jgi:glycosyltransferase involved in cell wall biosynthesis
MRFLFIHQNFPGQFVSLAPALARAGHEVRALTTREDIGDDWLGVQVERLNPPRAVGKDSHPWTSIFDGEVAQGERIFRAARTLKSDGFEPDAIIGHPGWGETLFVRDVWPTTPLGIYAEFFFSPDRKVMVSELTPPDLENDAAPIMRIRNLPWTMGLEDADAAISPTRFQADQFPARLRPKIEVIHDGIDTRHIRPDPQSQISLGRGVTLSAGEEVITFVNRNLEPLRGYHTFMRALPEVLARHPRARVILIGGDGSSYSQPPPEGRTWKDIYRHEVWPSLTEDQRERVHFVGRVPYATYLRVLQISMVHVYLTWPFVLSWSLMEAMSVGCAVVGSDTAPVTEMITDGETGRLVAFDDPAALAAGISDLLNDPDARRRLGAKAREHIIARYDRDTICLPAQMDWALRLARGQ